MLSVGFNGYVTMSVGTTRLSVSMERAIVLTNFVVLNTSTSYNTILGRPWIYKMRSIILTYHQLIKYPYHG